MSLSTHLPAHLSLGPSVALPRLASVPRALGRTLVRSLAGLYSDRPRPPAQSFWRDGDLPSVPYSTRPTLRR